MREFVYGVAGAYTYAHCKKSNFSTEILRVKNYGYFRNDLSWDGRRAKLRNSVFQLKFVRDRSFAQ